MLYLNDKGYSTRLKNKTKQIHYKLFTRDRLKAKFLREENFMPYKLTKGKLWNNKKYT